MIRALVSTADDEHWAFSGFYSFQVLPRIGEELFLDDRGKRFRAQVEWVRHFAIPDSEDDFDGGSPILGCKVLEVMEAND